MRALRLARFACLLFLTPALLADVDVELPDRATVKGTLMPDGEVDVFRFRAVAGSELTLTVSSKKKAPLDLAPVVTDPGRVPLDLADAKVFVDQDRKVRVTALPLPTTGEYTLAVAATGIGEYTLKLKVRPPRSASASESVPADGSVLVPFAAPANATLTLKARASKGSDAVPRFGAFGEDDLSTEGKLKPTSHVVKTTAGEGGDLEVEVTNDGTDADTIEVSVKIKAAKSKPAKLDVRGATLGEPGGGETFVGAFVDGAAGGTVTVDDEESGVEGAAATVPAGAFDGTVLLALGSAPAETVATTGLQAAGPTLSVGPAGASFSAPVTVTVPFDASRLPVGADADDVVVQHTSGATGTETLTPVAVDAVSNTVSVQVTGFSTFTPVVPEGSPSLDGRSYWFFGHDVDVIREMSGPSTYREFFRDSGSVSFTGVGAGTFSFSGTELTAFFGHDPDTGLGVVSTETGPLTEGGGGGTWAYEPDGRRITIEVGPGDTETYFVAADGSMLVPEVVRGDETTTRSALFVEKADTAPSPAALAGTYHVFDHRFEAVQTGSTLEMAGANSVGTFTVKADGSCSVSLTERESRFEPGGSGAFDRSVGKGNIPGTWSVQGDGSLLVSLDGETERFFPSADGTVILGATADTAPRPGEGLFSQVVLVRRGSGMGPGSLGGDYAFVGHELEYLPWLDGGPVVPDFETVNIEDVVALDGSTSLTSTAPYERIVRRDDQALGGVDVEQLGEDFLPPTFSLSKNGRFTVSAPGEPGGLDGAAHPAGTFVLGVQSPKTPEDFFATYMLLRLPPDATRP